MSRRKWVMQEHFERLVPEACVEALVQMYTAEDEDALLGGQPDFVIDAIDNIDTKVALLAACNRRGIPVICVAGAGAWGHRIWHPSYCLLLLYLSSSMFCYVLLGHRCFRSFACAQILQNACTRHSFSRSLLGYLCTQACIAGCPQGEFALH